MRRVLQDRVYVVYPNFSDMIHIFDMLQNNITRLVRSNIFSRMNETSEDEFCFRQIRRENRKVLTFIWAYGQRFGNDRYQSFVQPLSREYVFSNSNVFSRLGAACSMDSATLRLRQHSLATQLFFESWISFLNRADALVTPHTLVDYGLLPTLRNTWPETKESF